jgi:hypothetical protein
MPEGSQGIQGGLYLQNHIPTLAAISAIRTTSRHVLFPAEVYNTISPLTGTNLDLSLIDEHRGDYTIGTSLTDCLALVR